MSPSVTPQVCVELVGELIAGNELMPKAVESLLDATAPFESWRRFDEAIRAAKGPAAWNEAMPVDVERALDLAAKYEPLTPMPSSSTNEIFGSSPGVPPVNPVHRDSSLWLVRPAVAQIIAAHPSGHIRLAAVDRLRADRHPLPLVERALDGVPTVRGRAASILGQYWRQHPSDSSSMNAARVLVRRTAAIRRCPSLIPLAIDIAGSDLTRASIREFWTQERRRRTNELLRNLRSSYCDPSRPEQEAARGALVAFHQTRMDNAS